MSAPTHLDTICTYHRGCSTGDAALMTSVLAPDVVHYFTGADPVRGAEELAAYWVEDNAGARRTAWTIDRAMVDGDEAVIEWSMFVSFLGHRTEQRLRGARSGTRSATAASPRCGPTTGGSQANPFPSSSGSQMPSRGYADGPKE